MANLKTAEDLILNKVQRQLLLKFKTQLEKNYHVQLFIPNVDSSFEMDVFAMMYGNKKDINSIKRFISLQKNVPIVTNEVGSKKNLSEIEGVSNYVEVSKDSSVQDTLFKEHIGLKQNDKLLLMQKSLQSNCILPIRNGGDKFKGVTTDSSDIANNKDFNNIRVPQFMSNKENTVFAPENESVCERNFVSEVKIKLQHAGAQNNSVSQLESTEEHISFKPKDKTVKYGHSLYLQKLKYKKYRQAKKRKKSKSKESAIINSDIQIVQVTGKFQVQGKKKRKPQNKPKQKKNKGKSVNSKCPENVSTSPEEVLQYQRKRMSQDKLQSDNQSNAIEVITLDDDIERPLTILHCLRPIVIDGSNIAREHGKVNGTYSCKGIQICVEYFLKRGHSHVTAFVPQFRRSFCCNYPPTTDILILEQLAEKQNVVFTPSRTIGKRFISSYDDRFIVQLATMNGGVILSNDNYKDLVAESESFKETIETRLLMYCFVGDILMIPADPLGRHGPTLDDFLSFPAENTSHVT